MLKEALNEDDKRVRNCLPTTIQQKFNSSLSKIINKYPRTSVAKSLSTCLTSEPLPSKPYALPKDHKPGQLKGRPIISTCNSVVRPLAQLLADILYPLIPKYVPAHLDSTTQFVQIVKGLPCGPQYSFGSLDVVNLYGSIPLEDQNGVPGLVTFLCEFFTAHKMETTFSVLSIEDFRTLIKMCLYEDRYLFNGECRQQMEGIAMGNCAAPPFAIIYMHYIEEMIRTRHMAIIIWCRYIDDIFFVVEGDSESLCVTATTVNRCIQFTLEKPTDNKISFLDTLLHLEDGIFQLELFIKPTHSGTCLTFDSHAPLLRKKSLVISEILRAERISSPAYFSQSIAKVTTRLHKNGYPQWLLDNTIRRRQRIRPEQPEFIDFLRIPYLSEIQRKQILNAARRTNLRDKVRLIFTTPRSLGWQFRPKQESQPCPPNCVACSTSSKQGLCFVKYAVYRVDCLICHQLYIGQTSRTIRKRIIEHTNDPTSHIYQHMQSHPAEERSQFKWRVITTNKFAGTRLAIEALHIRLHRGHLMNGCGGIQLLPFI